ncbi:hypothetical protein AtNW77_Chr00c002g0321331 [Arabidopsis thaliana]
MQENSGCKKICDSEFDPISGVKFEGVRESLDEGHRDVLVSARKVRDKCTRSSDLGSEATKWGASSIWYVRNVLIDHPDPRKV